MCPPGLLRPLSWTFSPPRSVSDRTICCPAGVSVAGANWWRMWTPKPDVALGRDVEPNQNPKKAEKWRK